MALRVALPQLQGLARTRDAASTLLGQRGRLSFSGLPCHSLARATPVTARTSRRAVSVRADQRATGAGETEGGFSPAAPFFKVEAILRPWRVKFVCRALIEQGIRGVTVADVRGFGAQGGSRERQAGSEFADDSLVLKSKIEIVVVADQVEDVINTIITEARTGEIGDGKIFVSPVAEIIRVRTGERGVEAERMAGGRQDLLTQPHLFVSIDGKEIL